MDGLSQQSKQWLVYPHDQYDTKTVPGRTNQQAAGGKPKNYLQQLAEDYQKTGMRKSFRCVLMVHKERYLCAVCMPRKTQIVNSGGTGGAQDGNNAGNSPGNSTLVSLDLLGGHAVGSETVLEALKKKLQETVYIREDNIKPVEIGESLGVFWRPNFDDLLTPILPSHCSRPKERIELFQIKLPQRCELIATEKFDLVPLWELNDATRRPQDGIVEHLPQMIGRFHFCKMVEKT